MTAKGIDQDSFLSYMKVELEAKYTDEQLELIKRFGDGPTFCFASPGTGKTFTAVGGLINAEVYKGIPGQNIYAMSFTRLATGELATRHQKACKKLRMQCNVNFQTLHSLCRTILKENYRLLGMHKFESSGELPFDTAYKIVETDLESSGIMLTPRQIKNAIKACRDLNAALIFDPDTVQSKMVFKQMEIDYPVFDKIRGTLFSYSVLTETISVSDLLLYTIMLLTRHPEVSAAFKQKCKMLLVDEAQDLSLLQLRVISLLTDNAVFIGDMKQQIYAFNGACQEVIQESHKLFPEMIDLKLTQSFRCKNEIADHATKIILPNKIGGEDYKGMGDGGTVEFVNGLFEDGVDIHSLAEKLHHEFIANMNSLTKEYMFLDRTNVGLLPVIEELYQQHLPFRTNSYTMAYDIPVIKELCELLGLCTYPTDCRRATALRYLIPEFRGMGLTDNPYYQIMKSHPQSFFEINYQFSNPQSGQEAIACLEQVTQMLNERRDLTDIFNTMWPLYNECWLKHNAWKLDAKPEYYLNAINPLLHKPYAKFLQDEQKKLEIIEENENHHRGIRCYTMHASKGLEADIVYIVDANDGLIPNARKLEQMVKMQCSMDAARAIREERALCYVACTRAREELYIVTTTRDVAPMLTGENTFQSYDLVYESYKATGDDIEAFNNFTERYVPEL